MKRRWNDRVDNNTFTALERCGPNLGLGLETIQRSWVETRPCSLRPSQAMIFMAMAFGHLHLPAQLRLKLARRLGSQPGREASPAWARASRWLSTPWASHLKLRKGLNSRGSGNGYRRHPFVFFIEEEGLSSFWACQFF